MVLMGPLNALVARRMKSLQIEQMKNKDKRNKMMDEILNGIKIIKLYAWESSFRSKIDAIRVGGVKYTILDHSLLQCGLDFEKCALYRAFLQSQLWIINYYVKKLVKKSQ